MLRFLLCPVAAAVGLCTLTAHAQIPAGAAERREMARLRADFQVLQENNRKLAAAMETLNGQNRLLMERAQALENEVAMLRAEATAAKENFQRLKAAIEAEGQTRRESDQRIVESVTAQIEKVVAATRPPVTPTTGAATGILGTYKVARGDTLGAIAQAFDVSVKRIREVNGLTSDMIREGQELKIPKP